MPYFDKNSGITFKNFLDRDKFKTLSNLSIQLDEPKKSVKTEKRIKLTDNLKKIYELVDDEAKRLMIKFDVEFNKIEQNKKLFDKLLKFLENNGLNATFYVNFKDEYIEWGKDYFTIKLGIYENTRPKYSNECKDSWMLYKRFLKNR